MNKVRQNGGRLARQEREAHIISAAAALFAANGFKGTTTREIARTAHISEALLFKYFPTKRALYAAILAEKAPISELLEVVDEAAKKRDDIRVFTLIANYRIHRGSDPTLMRLLLFSALEGHELSDMFFRSQHRMFYDYLSNYIGQRIKERAFRPVDPLLVARAFMGMVAHHRLLHEIFRVQAHCSPEESVETYVTLFLDGIRRRSRGAKSKERTQ
ncbi:TetR/AcrR family transcriptional regulator [Candidatus Nitrospira bockiana]